MQPSTDLHQNMIRWIGEHGAVVSELSLGCSPMRHRFLSRNRVIAGLSMGTVVVEAAIRSGALSTANWTTRLSRPLVGVPGPVTSETSDRKNTRLKSSHSCGARLPYS